MMRQYCELTIATAADQQYWRCLHQFLLSAERRGFDRRYRVVAYDLGLEPDTLSGLRRRFPRCDFRRFAFENYPPHVAMACRSYAWKPVIVADLLEEFGGLVLWLDSATLFHSELDDVLATLRRHGTYSLKGQTPVGERSDPQSIAAVGTPAEFLHLAERAGGAVGFDAAHPGARRLAQAWKEHSLIEAHVFPRTPPLSCHRHEQTLLGLLLYKFQAEGVLTPNEGEIDLSCRAPVRWMTSRNKVAPDAPIWADPLVRAYYGAYKAVDQALHTIAHWKRTRFDGLHRLPKEHFSVFVARLGEERVVRIPAPRWSYYADPFLWRHDGHDWLFVEEFEYPRCKGRLCCVPLDGALRAGPPRPVLPLDVHASFPYLFEHAGQLYMVPETCAGRSIDLYACDGFPDRWRLARRLLYGVDGADSLVFQHDGRWWLITAQRESEAMPGRYLAIYHTDDLLRGQWQAHPVNAERRYHGGSGRNAGSLIRAGGALLRPMQENPNYYGESLRYMRIERLTPAEFREVPVDGGHPLVDLAQRYSPHHVSRSGDLVAWDVRDRVGYAERVPLLRRWAPRPDARALRLVAAVRH